MEYDKLIQEDFNQTYCILFQNKTALTIHEINRIFSEFGNVFNIHTSGDEKGYRFVRYKSYQEAINAIDGLRNHPDIKLAHHREKRSSVNEKQINSTKYKNNSKRLDSKNSFSKKSKGTSNIKKHADTIKCTTSNEESLIEQHCANNSSIHSDDNSCSIKSFSGEKSFKSQSNSVYHSMELSTHTDELEQLSLSESNSVTNGAEIPDLISTQGKLKHTEGKKIILNAEEVIVGNIHPDYGSPYILHLFDHLEPIAVSKIITIPKTGIRYCHVYFKTIQDSIKAESQFDRVILSDKKLVVLRPCQLIEEAKYF